MAVGIGLPGRRRGADDPGAGDPAAGGGERFDRRRARRDLGDATLIVGVAALALGGVLLALGISKLRSARPVPTRTIEQLQRDVEVAKEQVRNDDDPAFRAA